jgi:hypothetical protein
MATDDLSQLVRRLLADSRRTAPDPAPSPEPDGSL